MIQLHLILFKLLCALSSLDVLTLFLPQDSLYRSRVTSGTPEPPPPLWFLEAFCRHLATQSAGLRGAFYRREGALVLDSSASRKEAACWSIPGCWEARETGHSSPASSIDLQASQKGPPPAPRKDGLISSQAQRCQQPVPPPHFPISFEWPDDSTKLQGATWVGGRGVVVESLTSCRSTCFSRFPVLGPALERGRVAGEGSFQITCVSWA